MLKISAIKTYFVIDLDVTLVAGHCGNNSRNSVVH